MKKFFLLLLLTLFITSGFAQENESQTDSVKVYTSAELDKWPGFIGGDKKLNKFIRDNTAYPQEAAEANAGGLVIVQITIDQVGQVSNPRILKSAVENIPTTPRQDLKDEAIRVLMLSTGKWTPGILKGEKVASTFIIPVRFTPPASSKKI